MVIKVKTDEIMAYMKPVGTALLQQEAFKQLRQMIEAFDNDAAAQEQYDQFIQTQQLLQRKGQRGLEVTEEELANFELEEIKLYGNDTIRQFLYAQEQLSKVHDMISQYFIKTVELQRLPELREINVDRSCGCGSGCGCS